MSYAFILKEKGRESIAEMTVVALFIGGVVWFITIMGVWYRLRNG